MVDTATTNMHTARTETERDIWAILESVKDPEIPVLSVVDLGIAREVNVFDEAVEVVITPTYSGCPATSTIEHDIYNALEQHGFFGSQITTVLSPPWTTDWMTESGRRKLREYGIAPPEKGTGDKRALIGRQPDIACPHCGSGETELISEFGSTACKSLYRCTSCLEPFDYFKCI